MAGNRSILKASLALSLLSLPFLALQAPLAVDAFAEEDNRQLVKVDPAIEGRFLAEMRQDLDHLDDIMSAMAAGNMKEVANIAERKMGLGHKRIEKMLDAGASDAQIDAFIKKIRKMAEAGSVDPTKKIGGAGRGQGIGRFMPEELRAMGQEMHKSAYELADAAKSAQTPPTAEDYKKLLGALNNVTTNCRACHDTYRVR